jgi:hypothetical protein
MWSGTMARVGAGEIKKLNAIPERTEPTLWTIDQSENAKLNGELVACEKKRRPSMTLSVT